MFENKIARIVHLYLAFFLTKLFTVLDIIILSTHTLISMAHTPETGAINRLHFLAPVFGAGFSYHVRLSGMKISGAENKHG